MSLEENKQLAAELFARFSASDLAGALALLSDDVTWQIMGDPATLPAAGQHSKEGITRILRGMGSQLPNGLRMTVKGMIAEGDQVAVEVEGYGELQNGRVYNNHYHFALTMADGKIRTLREYIDTQHVFATWYAP